MAPSNLPAYTKDERALCFHHELLYEAKVLEHKYSEPNDKKSPILYRVHYKGWKNTWDDWVPQDRLRKFTEENKELAQDLRQELKREMDVQRARAAPKSASSRKKTGGSDFNSIRGSEERHSSVPVTGRGTKRGRDMDLDKVCHGFSSASGYYILDTYSSAGSDSGYDTQELVSPKRRKTDISLPPQLLHALPMGLDGAADESDSSSLSTLSSGSTPPTDKVENTGAAKDADPPIEPPTIGPPTIKEETQDTDSALCSKTNSGRTRRPTAKAIAREAAKAKEKPIKTTITTNKPSGVSKPKAKKQPERKPERKPEKKAEKKAEKKPEEKRKIKTEKPQTPPPFEQLETTLESEPEPEIPPDYHGEDKLNYGKINRSISQEEAFHSRPAVRLPIPDHLKALLVDDWEYVTKNLSLVPLPSAHPVNEVLTAYLEEDKLRRRPGSAEYDLLEEVVAGLKEYFDQTLGRILLYRFEREQYFQIRKKIDKGDPEWVDKTASDIYGPEHLCRLFVTLPELIAQTNMDHQSVNRLREELAKITSWLGKNSGRFFTVEYEAATPEYIEKARGAE